MAAHTPGPWKTRSGFIPGTVEIFHPDKAVKKPFVPSDLARVEFDFGAPGEGKANARLIAAAPDLLESLRELAQLLDMVLGVSGGYPPGADGPAVKARAAIAKATGEKS